MENKTLLLERFAQTPAIIQLKDTLQGKFGHMNLKGLVGSSKSMLANELLKKTAQNHLFILNDKEEAAYFVNDLNNLSEREQLLFFPSSYKRSIQYRQTDKGNIILRSEILNQLKDGTSNWAMVTYPEAIIEQVASKDVISENSLALHKGEKISIDFVNEVLATYEFERVDFVYEPGQYAIRGSIVDVFSYASELPYRIDFFGDEVESIRSFNIENQLSDKAFECIDILPNLQDVDYKEERESFFDYIDENTVIWGMSLQFVQDRIQHIYDKTQLSYENSASETVELNKDEFMINAAHFADKLKSFNTVEYASQPYFTDGLKFEFNTGIQPAFNKNFDLLIEELHQKTDEQFEIFILSESEKQLNRLEHIFQDKNAEVKYHGNHFTIHEGFVDYENRICVYTDHQIFDRYHKFKVKQGFDKKETLSIKELSNLHPGDYVVHIDHGIGKFGGLVQSEKNGKTQEAIRLIYKDGDILDVSIHGLHRISKYKGKDGAAPKIHKLGSAVWQKLKQNTKKKVKDIAKELIALYAQRKEEKGFSFSADTYMQEELEASFIYEDTPDQVKATRLVKQDMENGTPMDRLVCGDVGFGKTEIAIRAAFKAVADSKQVAILVPTTILALQHYKTFSERLKDFPCRIEYVSRLKKGKALKEALKGAAEGQVDILIGTHRLLSKDIAFKDLGLLIIDEEQKFGVSSKEKLKHLKLNVDTLTLTATPIPRTLQFSLMGARDLSVINTPPPNRHPILTEVHTFDENIIKEAIYYEFERNGQIFFINNRIQNIFEIEKLIQRLCPEVRTVVAHGQMEGPKLEKIMLDFIDFEYDVLIATTIIESGLDIPNANTILINNAQNFGLSELHQLRGRVGRSNKKAFAYLMAPALSDLPQDSRRRLMAIENFSELGSGFNISLQDLDIRGAGNMLGGEQSGFITDIGYETYQRILNEALLELRETEFKDVFKETDEEKTKAAGYKWVNDCQIDTDLEIRIPEEYVHNISERILLYRRLDSAEDDQALEKIGQELADRFGPLPESVSELLMTVRLRWRAMELGIEKMVIKNNKFIAGFIQNKESAFYQSQYFMNVIRFIQQEPKKFKMKEDHNKLRLFVEGVNGITDAIRLLEKIQSA